MTVTITNNIREFSRMVEQSQDDALREVSRDVLINAKKRAPFDKGGLRSDSTAKKIGKLRWRISFLKEYARFQEFGGTAQRRVRNYTTSGTGKLYLTRSGDEGAKKLPATIIKHATRIR